MAKQKAGILRLLALGLLAVYTVLAVKTVIFPFYFDTGVFHAGAPLVNFLPFKSILDIWAHTSPLTALKQIGGNILLFVPLGFLAPVAVPRLRTFPHALLLILASTAAIELAQLLISLITGIPNRITDIDDMPLNLVGGLCGYLAFYLIFRVIRKGKTI